MPADVCGVGAGGGGGFLAGSPQRRAGPPLAHGKAHGFLPISPWLIGPPPAHREAAWLACCFLQHGLHRCTGWGATFLPQCSSPGAARSSLGAWGGDPALCCPSAWLFLAFLFLLHLSAWAPSLHSDLSCVQGTHFSPPSLLKLLYSRVGTQKLGEVFSSAVYHSIIFLEVLWGS